MYLVQWPISGKSTSTSLQHYYVVVVNGCESLVLLVPFMIILRTLFGMSTLPRAIHTNIHKLCTLTSDRRFIFWPCVVITHLHLAQHRKKICCFGMPPPRTVFFTSLAKAAPKYTDGMHYLQLRYGSAKIAI